MMRDLGWLDSYNGLIWIAGANVFGIFLLRQHFQSIPFVGSSRLEEIY
ncbi:MAG: hypothetical protein ACJ8CR_33130 [Roseiflexaceae bacterium]